MEVGHHGVGHREFVGREDELVGPALHRLIMPLVETAVSTVRMTVVPMATILCPSRLAELTASAASSVAEELLKSILYFERSSTSTVQLPRPTQRDEGLVDALDLHALHQVLGEVHATVGRPRLSCRAKIVW